MPAKPHFRYIPLGVAGGLDEADLTAHLVAPLSSDAFVCLDAGTLQVGLRRAVANGCFAELPLQRHPELSPEGAVLHHHIKAYLITHSYLDHLAGLLHSSPSDTPKPILALPGTIADLREHVFNWRTWPNFSDQGVEPRLGVYRLQALPPGEPVAIAASDFRVEAHPLAHGPQGDSAAFLLESGGRQLLFMGDTGPDAVEGTRATAELWRRIAPLIRAGSLQAIFIEASYPDGRPDDQLYSHLTPAWLMAAMRQLAELVDPAAPEQALQGLQLVIIHMKPDLSAAPPAAQRIRAQLEARNDLGLRLLFPEQARSYQL